MCSQHSKVNHSISPSSVIHQKYKNIFTNETLLLNVIYSIAQSMSVGYSNS